jgi:hypothetical protein
VNVKKSPNSSTFLLIILFLDFLYCYHKIRVGEMAKAYIISAQISRLNIFCYCFSSVIIIIWIRSVFYVFLLVCNFSLSEVTLM